MSVHETEPDATNGVPAADAIATEVFGAVADSLNLTAADIRPDQSLEADLGIDSLGMIQIGVSLEHALGFRAPGIDDALGVETVGDLVELVRAQLAGR
jgi:acyl carrier protein